jgi:uncharacterized phiE125 gp8 family phage protein
MRIDSTGEAGKINALIGAARAKFENDSRRQLVSNVLEARYERFPLGRQAVLLPRPPLQSVAKVSYAIADTTVTTHIDDSLLVVDTYSEPGRVGMVNGESWPSVRRVLPVTITYQAGYGTQDEIPKLAKQGMLMLISHWHEHRESVITSGTPKEIEHAYNAIVGSYHYGDYW